ncbi:PREDICTED: pentatricopeptide repeat-containing protein At4g19440, chloroplastic-like [Fragaria vesca subsp. vesca]
MVKMVALTLRSLYRSGSSVAVNKLLLWVDLHDGLEQYAFRMFDYLRQEGLADEANQIFRPLLQKKRANVPAVAVFTYMIDALLTSGDTNMALNVYRYILATGVTPSSFTCNVLILGLSVAAWSVLWKCWIREGSPIMLFLEGCFADIAWLETVEEVRGFLGFVPDDDCFDFDKENLEDMIKAMKLHVYLVTTADDDMRRVLHDWLKQGTQKQADNMRKALLDDGNRHEAWMLFEKQYSESSMHHMVVLYTCVIETFINAGKTKGALEVYQHMLDDGYAPCSYTYSILIKALAADPSFFGDAKKYFLEMMEKGIRPNAATYTAVLEGFARQEDNAAVEEGRKFVKVMMVKGFVPYTEDVMKVLRGKPEPAVTRVMDIMSSKWNY